MLCCANFLHLAIVLGIKVPGRPMISRVISTEVTIDWASRRSNVIEYVIYYGISETDLELCVKPKTEGRSNSYTFSKDKLTSEKSYKFAVAAKTKAGISCLSEFSEDITIPDDTGKSFVQSCGIISYYYNRIVVFIIIIFF